MAEDEENGTSPREAEAGHGVQEVGRDNTQSGGDYNNAGRDNNNAGRDNVNAGRDNNNAARDINLTNIINNNYKATESEEDIRDPTDDFPNGLFNNFTPFLKESEVQEYVNKLKDQKILLISSATANYSLRAALSLIRHHDFQSYRCRLLRFDSHEGRFKHDRLAKVSVGKNENALVMAEIAADEIIALLPQMHSRVEHLREILAKANLCLMVVVSTTDGAISAKINCPVENRNVDFPKFRAQRAGDRPAADTATELKTVEDRFDDVLKNADKDRPLYLAALYVACYFYEARPGDFNLLGTCRESRRRG